MKTNPPTGEKLKKEIRQKFRTVARFCRISGMEYKIVNSILRGNDPQLRMDLYIAVSSFEDRPLPGELSKIEKIKIRERLAWYGKMKPFCKKYGFDATWMSRLLSEKDYGAIRLDSPNLKRLLEILNLEL